MNQTELLQLMIINAVKEGVNQALKPLQEELGKVKTLAAKVLREQAELKQQLSTQLVESATPVFKKIGSPSAPTVLEAAQPGYRSPASNGRTLESFKAEAAAYVQADGMLPDIDIPIELFLKK